jgi:hypothetical protein
MDDYDVLIFYANYAMYEYMSPSFIDVLMALLIISMMSRDMCYGVIIHLISIYLCVNCISLIMANVLALCRE